MQLTYGTSARDKDASVAESGKQREGGLAGASMSSLTEVLGNKLCLLPQMTPSQAQ